MVSSMNLAEEARLLAAIQTLHNRVFQLEQEVKRLSALTLDNEPLLVEHLRNIKRNGPTDARDMLGN
jgi:hypothetical protein